MRCPKCYHYKVKDKQTNKYPQMKLKKEYLICPLCGYKLVSDDFLALRQFVDSKEECSKICAELH